MKYQADVRFDVTENDDDAAWANASAAASTLPGGYVLALYDETGREVVLPEPADIEMDVAKRLTQWMQRYLPPGYVLPHYPDEWAIAEGQRYLLVEESVRDGSYLLSTHITMDDAARNNTASDFAEDWKVDVLVDLENGDRYDANRTMAITWESKDPLR